MAVIRAEIIKDKEKPLSNDWRKDKFLWKPDAAHYQGMVVLTLPFTAARSIVVYDLSNKKIKTLTFRKHTGSEAPAGDAWADYTQTGAWYHKNYPKGILVKVTYTDKSARTFKLSNPEKRSDGK